MIKKISLAAIIALSTATVVAPPASANTACTPGDPTCVPTTPVIPTPPALLAVLGMGFAGLRKKNEENGDTAE